ncbi:hypothetical protein [Halomarina rubra]|uniref:Uncharacterized protein n=1 Tax=Halomarina rubra TaxID=2071873 RepID=A0ABD6AWK4_9EURY|nr:hypothetical protein [Halomarina rubra]
MVPTRFRPPPSRLVAVLFAVCGVLAYEFALLWSRYGPVSVGSPWSLGLLAMPVVLMLTATRGRWDSRTVVALLVLGVVASAVGFLESTATVVEPALTGETYYALEYDWQSNTLLFGETAPGGTPVGSARPNRLSAVLGAVALALGVYGWLPRQVSTRSSDDCVSSEGGVKSTR